MKSINKKTRLLIKSNFFLGQLPVLLLLFSLQNCQQNNSETEENKQLTEEEKRKVENALQGFEIYENLDATLFASEPMVVNPTNIDVDAKGRVWVCEGINYRPTLNVGNAVVPEGDKIVILEDTNGDGKADINKTFYQGNEINVAMGIAVFGNKVLVSASPNMYIFSDDDGDDKADSKEVLFTGIGGNQNDHALHAVSFGPDGNFYFNFGNAGGQIKDKNGNPIKDTRGNIVNNSGNPYRQGMLFRCKPDGSELEVLGHNFRNIYEVAVDSYGNIWQTDNDDDGNKAVRVNYIIEYGNYGYTDEMTGAGWRNLRTGMHEEIPKRHWYQNSPGVIPNLLYTGAGSPSGLAVYEGSLLPEIFQGQMIHCDAGPNVVRAYPVKKKGAGFEAYIENIFKSTSDSWFRPIDVCVAPDGSLIIADWYDPGVGGHQAGDQQQGRVFRIAPKGIDYTIKTTDISSPKGAVEALKSPNMATRYLAWNALHNWGKDAEEALATLLNSDIQWERARALWLLAKIEGKTEKYINYALTDDNEDIRLTGLRIAKNIKYNQLSNVISLAIKDPSWQLKREAAVALTRLKSDKMPILWAELAVQYEGNDRWFLEALGVAADEDPEACFVNWMEMNEGNWNTPAGQEIIWRIRSAKALPLIASLITHPAASKDMMQKYFRALDFHDEASKDEVLLTIANTNHSEKAFMQELVLNHISAEAVLTSASLKKILYDLLEQKNGTLQYIDWIKKYQLTDQQEALTELMLAKPNSEVGIASARLLKSLIGINHFKKLIKNTDEITLANTMTAMTHLGDNDSWEFLKTIAFDDTQEMNIRKKAVRAIGTGWEAEDKLLGMLSKNEIPEELVNIAANTLMNAYKGSVRKEAAKFVNDDKDESIPDIASLVAKNGSVTNGKQVFEKLCSTCHQVNGNGINFGPDLTEIGNKLSKDGLYSAIIYPDAGINFGYEGFVISQKDGSRVVGYIVSKTENELQVRQMGGTTITLSRSEIESIEEMDNSLMTSGLYKSMTEDELISLVSYLESLKGDQTLAKN
ncbi:MAG: PVC-type heme-binding CxxCH protein [Bacteroidota bacterium]